MNATFLDLLLGQKDIVLPARVSIINNKGEKNIYAQPLLKSTEKMRNFGIKVNQNNLIDLVSDGDCVYISVKKNQVLSIFLFKSYGGGFCYIYDIESNKAKYDEIVDSIIYLNENIGYDSILNKRAISIDLYDEIDVKFKKIKDVIKISESEFKQVFEIRKAINDLKIIDKKLLKLQSCLNNIEKDIESKDFELKSKQYKQSELQDFINANQWVEKIKPYITDRVIDSIPNDNEVFDYQPSELFNHITNSLKDRFNLSDDFIHCYLLSLFTSLMQGRFLLLTGHIGTGKSSIIKETGKLLGGQTNVVAVRPAWLDASDLLGYFDPINNRYHSTDFVRFIKQENNNHINMILLDELNIARIENYGADILACLAEIGERNHEQNKIHLFNQDLQELIHTYQLFEELSDTKKQKYQHILDRIKQSSSIVISDNVLICGTLNIDGSTENLSPKMIDRSFMLKFPDFDGQLGGIKEIKEQVPLLISQIIHSVRKRDAISVQKWNGFYSNCIESIKDNLIPISNRVAKDYLVFCQFAEFFGVDDEHKINALFFYARILPRLRIEKLNDNIRQNILSKLNSFSNIELFSTFVKEISHSKNNGNFLDYQHICG